MALGENETAFGGWSRSFQESMRSHGNTPASVEREASKHRVLSEGSWRYRLEDDGDATYCIICGYSGRETSVIVPEAFDNAPVKRLAPRAIASSTAEKVELPSTLEELDPAAISGPKLESIVIRANSSSLSTDGVAIYTVDGSKLISCPVPVENYALSVHCKEVGDSAFKGMTSLKSLEFNEGLEHIGSFAFFRTSIIDIEFPPTLRSIAEKAFASAKLESVTFKEGIESVGSQAFANTKIRAAHLPASLKHLGDKAFWHCNIDYTTNESFTIDAGNPSLTYAQGLLYSRDAEGLHLLEAIAPARCCSIAEGTVQVCSHAFENRPDLEAVILPAGLVVIGERAFASCKNLNKAVLPESLRLVGAEAFYDTAIQEVTIGSRLTDIGPCAFEVAGDGRLREKPQLLHLSVSSENTRYKLENGMLIEKRDTGDRVLLYAGDKGTVHIPEGVVEVAEMAFYNAYIDELFIPSTLKKVSQRGFLGCWGFEKAHIVYPEAYEGYAEVTVPFPKEPRDRWDYSRALAMNSQGVFLDFEIFDAYAVHELDTDRVVEIALSRLLNPIDLSRASKANYESAVLRYLPHALATFKHFANQGAFTSLKEYWRKNEKAKSAAESLISSQDDEVRSIYDELMRE